MKDKFLIFCELFEKHKWTKWQHIMFVEMLYCTEKTHELLRRECLITGLIQYKQIVIPTQAKNVKQTIEIWHAENIKIKQNA